jgi:hypothetical protein
MKQYLEYITESIEKIHLKEETIMNTFREIALLEALKLQGKLKKYEKILYESYIDFLKDYYKVNENITISFRKPNSKKFFGFIDLVGLSTGKYKIVVENIHFGILGKIGHEFTHIKQYCKGEFNFTEDYKTFIWKGKENMTVKEYNEITSYEEFKKIPWETEAYKMQEELPVLYKKSKFYKEILGKDATLDFSLENGLFF